MPPYSCRQAYAAKILLPGTADYEICRQNNPSGQTPDVYPAKIHVVYNVTDVIAALKRASEMDKSVGVRSGGHSMTNGHLFEGILIDTTHLHRQIEYDSSTHEISFGPAVRVKELAEALREVDRFYPHGHCPSVAAGGFHLGGGQGVGMRGWGPTYRDWLIRLQIVVPGGHAVTADRTENSDLFWAARGSGPAFFGVVTKYWARTIPRTKWWEQQLLFTLGNNYKPLMRWFIEQSKKTPRKGTELTAIVYYPAKAHARQLPDKPPVGSTLHYLISNIGIAETEEEANTMLHPYQLVPDELKPSIVHQYLREMTLEDMWAAQDTHWHCENGELWKFQGLAMDESVDLDKLLSAAEPKFTDIPTLRSAALAVIPNWEPLEEDCAYSIHMSLYLCCFAGWTDQALTPALENFWRDKFQDLLVFSSGMAPIDYDITNDHANSKPMSDTALARFLEIRKKWDPEGLFTTYRKYITTRDKMNNLWQNGAVIHSNKSSSGV